jgi:DNA-binding response OmpR family regulator
MTTADEGPADEANNGTIATTRVLVVEDDEYVAFPVVRTLEAEGYTVTCVNSGAQALAHLAREATDLVILDLGLPDMDGLNVCTRARAAGFEGAIMIATGRGAELDRVVGLDHGADDYLAKPFGLAEFQARARALVRRSARVTETPRATSGVVLHLDPGSRRVRADDVEFELRAKEFDLLNILTAQPGKVVARDRLMSEVWSKDWYGSPKTLDMTIARLRQKLADVGVTERIVAVRGIGFRFEAVEAG